MAEQLLEGPHQVLSDDPAMCRLDLGLVSVVFDRFGARTSTNSRNRTKL